MAFFRNLCCYSSDDIPSSVLPCHSTSCLKFPLIILILVSPLCPLCLYSLPPNLSLHRLMTIFYFHGFFKCSNLNVQIQGIIIWQFYEKNFRLGKQLRKMKQQQLWSEQQHSRYICQSEDTQAKKKKEYVNWKTSCYPYLG